VERVGGPPNPPAVEVGWSQIPRVRPSAAQGSKRTNASGIRPPRRPKKPLLPPHPATRGWGLREPLSFEAGGLRRSALGDLAVRDPVHLNVGKGGPVQLHQAAHAFRAVRHLRGGGIVVSVIRVDERVDRADLALVPRCSQPHSGSVGAAAPVPVPSMVRGTGSAVHRELHASMGMPVRLLPET
jgi:hypothetical protein